VTAATTQAATFAAARAPVAITDLFCANAGCCFG